MSKPIPSTMHASNFHLFWFEMPPVQLAKKKSKETHSEPPLNLFKLFPPVQFEKGCVAVPIGPRG